MSFDVADGISFAKEKQMFRNTVRRLANSVALEAKFNASLRIFGNLFSLPEFRRAKVIHTYVASFPWEVPTISIIANIINRGGISIIPVVEPESKELRHYPLKNITDLKRGEFKVWGPQFLPPSCANPGDADVIIVPGTAFDKKRNRLGMGKGYYDRFLPKMNQPKIALAYSFQLFDLIPADDFDQKVDSIVSEYEIIR